MAVLSFSAVFNSAAQDTCVCPEAEATAIISAAIRKVDLVVMCIVIAVIFTCSVERLTSAMATLSKMLLAVFGNAIDLSAQWVLYLSGRIASPS